MADTNQEAEELENWIDDTREKIFKVYKDNLDTKVILVKTITMIFRRRQAVPDEGVPVLPSRRSSQSW